MNDRRLRRRHRAAQIRSLKEGPCLLCDEPTRLVGVFLPTPEVQRRLLAPPGKERAVVVPLCGSCAALPDAMDRALDQILAEIEQGSNNQSWN